MRILVIFLIFVSCNYRSEMNDCLTFVPESPGELKALGFNYETYGINKKDERGYYSKKYVDTGVLYLYKNVEQNRFARSLIYECKEVDTAAIISSLQRRSLRCSNDSCWVKVETGEVWVYKIIRIGKYIYFTTDQAH
jgi:hypothetical protein